MDPEETGFLMEPDDEKRGSTGVVASLLDVGDDKIRITLDDVGNSNGQPDEWSHRIFVTSKSYGREELENFDLPEDEYAALGHYVIARLLALRGHL